MHDLPVHVARHFWRDGEFATWQASKSFPASLLAWLKINYSELVSGSRPQWIDRPEGKLYLFFSDEYETHGRLATKLTACWLDLQAQDAITIHLQLSKEIKQINNNELVDISIKTQNIKQKAQTQHKLVYRSIFFGCCIVIILSIGYWIMHSRNPVSTSVQSKQHTAIQNNKMETVNQHIQIINDSRVRIKKQIPNLNNVCANESHNIQYCYQQFILEKCNGNISVTYNRWLQKTKKNDLSKFTNYSCPKDLRHDEDVNQLDSKRKKHIQFFLENEVK